MHATNKIVCSLSSERVLRQLRDRFRPWREDVGDDPDVSRRPSVNEVDSVSSDPFNSLFSSVIFGIDKRTVAQLSWTCYNSNDYSAQLLTQRIYYIPTLHNCIRK